MAARPGPWIALAAVVAGGCFPDPDYRGTAYLCGAGDTCPADHDCVSGRCVARGGALAFVDDGLDGEFGAGRFEGTSWTGSALEIAGGAAQGAFVSRVFDAGSPVVWKTIGWVPSGPYGKPLPDLAGIERSYAEGGIDMTGDVVLLHFDDGAAVPGGARIADASGRANDATAVSDGGLHVGGGLLGGAIEVSPGNFLSLATGTGSDLEFGVSDFTWSLWVRTVQDCAGNKNFIGEDQQAGSGGTHIWLGCAQSSTNVCSSATGEAGGRAAGFFTSEHGTAGDGGGYCGTSQINDGEWHHVAVVKTGHATVEIEVYVDGAAEGKRIYPLQSPFSMPSGRPLTMGTFPDPGYDFIGVMDEIAIWRRALSAAELRALYRRGALDLTLQVRACVQPDCADDPPFSGPSSATDAFGDHTPSTAPPAPRGLALAPTRYAQYRIAMTGRAGDTPGLRSVTLTADRP
jgi:hypothetical protein